MSKAGEIKAKKNLKMRKALWPNIQDKNIWKKENIGYTYIPRAMPYFFLIMDNLSSVGPLSKTYFAIWCRVFPEGFLEVTDENTLAFESGLASQKKASMWRKRMQGLTDMGFIKAKEGPASKYQYVLFLNPYHVIQKLKDQGDLQERYSSPFFSRAIAIGATDLEK